MKYLSTQGRLKAQRQEAGETRLQGRLLRVAQAAWILVAVIVLLLVVVSLPPYYTQVQSVCRGGACTGVQTFPEQAHALATYGFPSRAMPGTAWW